MKRFLPILCAALFCCISPMNVAAKPRPHRHPAPHSRPIDATRSRDFARLAVLPAGSELISQRTWHVLWHLDLWPSEDAKRRGERPQEYVAHDNLLLTAGATRLLNLLVGAGGQAFDNTHARLGVGNGTTAVVIGDTDLSASSGSSNRWFQTMDATYPQVSGASVTFRASYGTSDANFTYNEFGTDAGTASSAVVAAPLLNRKLASPALITKSSGATATLTETITISSASKVVLPFGVRSVSPSIC